MNNQKYADINRKLPGGTAVQFNGSIAYVEHDPQNGFIHLRDNKSKSPMDVTFVISKSEIKLPLKINKPIQCKQTKATKAKKKVKDEYTEFYNSIAPKVTLLCENCRTDLFAFTKFAKRSVSAHILPKSIYKSIATDPKNILFMGAENVKCPCRCHDLWDSTVENRVHSKMKRAHEIAVKRFNDHLKAKLTNKEIISAEEYLGLRTKSLNLSADIANGGVKA